MESLGSLVLGKDLRNREDTHGLLRPDNIEVLTKFGLAREPSTVIWFFSGEWVLSWRRYAGANGGSVIFFRALWTALWVYAAAFALRTTLDPRWRLEPWASAHLSDTMTWFGAIFAAMYAALYARFAAQWTYLANLYNTIKEAQIREKCAPCDSEPMASWLAGFI